MNASAIRNHRGFTLIEIIITLVVVSALVSLVLPLATSFQNKTAAPVNNLQNTMAAYQVMEQITAEYLKRREAALSAGTSVDLNAFKTAIGSGTVTNSFGSYTVNENKFITFTSNTEQNSVATTILKVSISNGAGIVLTTLFTAK